MCNLCSQYEKPGLKGKKCIFIRYSELSKRFVFVGEKVDSRVTEFESRDVVFLKKDYPTRGEIEKDFQFYEMEDLDYDAPSHSVGKLEKTLIPSKNSGSDYVPDSTLMDQDHEQSQPRQSTHERIPHHRFEIEGESLMIAPHDDEEPKTVNEALSGPKVKEWIKVMEEEIESMKTN